MAPALPRSLSVAVFYPRKPQRPAKVDPNERFFAYAVTLVTRGDPIGDAIPITVGRSFSRCGQGEKRDEVRISEPIEQTEWKPRSECEPVNGFAFREPDHRTDTAGSNNEGRRMRIGPKTMRLAHDFGHRGTRRRAPRGMCDNAGCAYWRLKDGVAGLTGGLREAGGAGTADEAAPNPTSTSTPSAGEMVNALFLPTCNAGRGRGRSARSPRGCADDRGSTHSIRQASIRMVLRSDRTLGRRS